MLPRSRSLACLVVTGCLLPLGSQAANSPSPQPPGQAKSGETRTLEAGAKLLQSKSPLSGFNIYLDGFHVAKNNPAHQMEAHHYCKQVNQDFAQCILFDGNGPNANLTGIEYIISEKIFKTLPASERPYWHPHNFEILSGELVGPGLPNVAEHRLMRAKINSYGKTWHVWQSGMYQARNDRLPFGNPVLAWSFNHDGEILPGMEQARDKRMGISTPKKRASRQDLVKYARPQAGVDALKGKFGRLARSIPGVVDRLAAGGKG